MSGLPHIPSLLLVCTRRPDTGEESPAAQREIAAAVQLLTPVTSDGSFHTYIIQEGATQPDVLLEPPPGISLIHLAGPPTPDQRIHLGSRPGEWSLTPEAFATLAGNQPALNLVILSGMPTTELIERLLLAGVPAVLALDGTTDPQRLTGILYNQFMQGKSIRQAFQALQLATTPPLAYQEVTYDPEQHRLRWDRTEATIVRGLVVRTQNLRVLNWRMRNPLLIPVSEKETQPAPVRTDGDTLSRADKTVTRRQRLSDASESDTSYASLLTRTLPGTDKTLNPSRRPERKRPQKNLNPEIAWAQKRRIRIRWILAALALMAASVATGLLIFPSLTEQIREWILPTPDAGRVCPFPEAGGKYHVLVLPFRDAQDCQSVYSSYHRAVTKYVTSIAGAEKNLDVRFLNLADCTGQQEKAQELILSCNADLVIMGRVEKDAVSGQQYLNLYFATQNRVAEQLFIESTGSGQRIPISSDEQVRASLRSVVGSVVYWALGVRHLNAGQYEQSLSAFELLPDTSRAVISLVASMTTQCYLQAGQYDKAKQYYDDQVRRYPQEPRAYIDRAGVLTAMKDYAGAEADYNTALALDPTSASALTGRGTMFAQMKDYTRALSDFNKVITANPDLPSVYCRRAEVFADMQRTGDAMHDYETAIRISPGYAEGYYGRATLYQRLGQDDKALRDLEDVVKIAPDNKYAWLLRGDILTRRGEWQAALEGYTRLITRLPSPDAYVRRGGLYAKLGRFDEAIGDYTQALAIHERYEPALSGRAQAWADERKFSDAMADLNLLISINPRKPEYYWQRGDVQVQLNLPEAALADYNEALNMAPGEVKGRYQRGLLFMKLGRYAEALADIDVALTQQPRDASGWYHRGLIQEAQDHRDEALGSFAKAIQIEPCLADAWLHQGLIHVRSGDGTAAAADLDKAIACETQAPEAYRLRGELMIPTQPEKALQLLSKAIALGPQYGQSYATRAACYLTLRQYENALPDLEKALQLLPPVQIKLLTDRAWLYAKLNNPTQALADYNRAIQAAPDSARLYCLRAQLLADMKQPAKAAEDAEAAIRLDPTLPQAWLVRVNLAFEEGNYAKALQDLNEVISLHPRYAEAYNKRGEVQAAAEVYDKALADFTYAIQLNPTLASAYNNRGNLARKAGDYDRALRDFGQALAHDPYLADAWYNRGFLYSLKGEYTRAINDIQRSLELKPDEGLRYGFLAKIYARQHQEDLMYKYLEIALKNRYPIIELQKDPAFKAYQADPRFVAIIEAHQAAP
ncbi:MAG: tetratricopeptide repeat protein [Bacteroidia bacterium]|nr:tetratricopeptide repeat protein [Bacteroidia bacterium]